MSIRELLEKKLSENTKRHQEANQETHLDYGQVLKRIPMRLIRINPYQPRIEFSQQELASLAESISQVGLLQPITVREIMNPDDEYQYEIIAGERRFRAFQLLEKTHIDAIIGYTSDADSAILALAENMQRQDLSDYEIGKALKQIEQLFPNKTRMAESIGLNRQDMYRYFNYFDLPEIIVQRLEENPSLLSRTSATQLKQAIAQLQVDEKQLNPVLTDFLDLIVQGKLDQTKFANTLKQHFKDSEKEIVVKNTLVKPFMLNNQQIGKIQHKGKNFVIELDSSHLDVQAEQKIEQFIQQLLNNTSK